MFLLRFLGIYEVPCTHLVNINIKDILLCIKDTPPISLITLCSKRTRQYTVIFPPHEDLTASMLMFCVMVGRGSNPKMQAVPTFLVAKGVSKLDTSWVWWGAVPSLGATNFLSHWWEVPNSRHGNEQTPNGHRHTHETRLGICLFPCPSLFCI